jgi:proto-oncogene tyrosine-protein kinase Met/macrophage-stimulating 1 receptor
LFDLAFILHESDIVSFLKEGLIMKDLNHCNVLKLRGICFGDDSTPIILLPFMERGDLLSFIREMENILTVEDLSNFALGIASGN